MKYEKPKKLEKPKNRLKSLPTHSCGSGRLRWRAARFRERLLVAAKRLGITGSKRLLIHAAQMRLAGCEWRLIHATQMLRIAERHFHHLGADHHDVGTGVLPTGAALATDR